MPADLAAVQADDTLLDLIGRAGYAPSDAHDELTRVLAGWRQEMDAEPFSELVDTDTALAVIRAARQPARRRNPVFGSIAAAAAVLVIAFSTVGLVAKSAQPGDRLWGVTQVLYGDYAHSVETAAEVRTELNEAKTAMKQGNPERARASLQRVQTQLPAISESEGRTDLTARHRELEQMLNGSPEDGSATIPGGPMFPPSGARSGRDGSSTSSESAEAATSTGSTTSPNPTTESSDSATAPGPTGVTPRPDYPHPGYPGPGGGPSDADTPGDHRHGGGVTGGGTVGKDSSRADNSGTARRDLPNGGAPPPPSRDHMHGYPSGGGAAPGCDLPRPQRPPYCG
jgi:hypothetical protein